MDTDYQVLYISDVDNSFHRLLWRVFAPWEESIDSIRIVVDPASRSPLGHAYINFTSHEPAAEALAKVQPLFLGSSLCRVFPFNGQNLTKPPPVDPTLGTGVFVKNLDSKTRVQQLYDLFKKFGTIVACKIATDVYGVPRNFAYVTFSTREAAEKAVKEMNDFPIGKRKITTNFNLPKSKRGSKLFVKFLGTPQQYASEEALKEVFSQFPSFESVSYPVNAHGGPRGFAFVVLQDAEDAEKAIAEITSVGECPVAVSMAARAQDDKTKLEPTNLFVRNLNERVTEEDLTAEFGKYGSVVSTKIMLDDSGRSRHFGFVRFASALQAYNALLALDGAERWGNKLHITPAQRQKKTLPKSLPYYALGAPPAAYGARPEGFYYYQPEYAYGMLDTQQLGEMLHPSVLKHSLVSGDAGVASMVTGILLQKDPVQIMQWLYDPHALDHVIAKAHKAYVQLKKDSERPE